MAAPLLTPTARVVFQGAVDYGVCDKIIVKKAGATDSLLADMSSAARGIG